MRKSLLKKYVNIERRRDTKNKIMATESTWSILHRSVPCEIEAVSAKEQNFQHRESVEKLFRLYCEPIDVAESDRVIGRVAPLERYEKYEIIGIEEWGKFLLMRLRLWQ